jgi:hypothetical protein
MNVRSLLLCIGLAVSPMVASAQSAQDAIIRQLTEQGFVNISVTTTLLGRVRILAESADLRREIVFNPVTGEILRDFWEPRGGQTATPRPTLVNPRPSGSDGSGGSSASDDDDDNGGSTGRAVGRTMTTTMAARPVRSGVTTTMTGPLRAAPAADRPAATMTTTTATTTTVMTMIRTTTTMTMKTIRRPDGGGACT